VAASGSFRLDGKVAVITGASRNIGAAISRAFAEAGADLLLVARGEERLIRFAQQLRAETGQRVETLVADVTDPAAAHAVSERIDTRFAAVDILVNNAYAAGNPGAPVVDTTDEEWDHALDANLLAPVRLYRALVPTLERRGGSIINVVSGSGFLPTPGGAAYGVSKAALWMLMRYLAVEAAPRVRVNALCPGIVSPDGEPEHDVQRRLLPLVPMGRLGRPEEMTGAALYLASDLSSYTTGEVIVVNGGRPW